MENKKTNAKKFDVMNYFSVIRIVAALLLSIVLIFVIIFFVSETPGLAIQKLMLGPLETKRSFFNVVVRGIPLVFTGLGLTLCLKSGIFNISSDASFYMGAVVATAIAISFPPAQHCASGGSDYRSGDCRRIDFHAAGHRQ